MMTDMFVSVMQWLVSALMLAMATFALLEAKSASLIPKSLFLWPLAGFLSGLLLVVQVLCVGGMVGVAFAPLAAGAVLTLCSIQALLVNMRRLPRWPSGSIWLAFVFVGILYQAQPAWGLFDDMMFSVFYGRLVGYLWAAIGVTKVVGEKTISGGSGAPIWIVLLFVQSVLLASFPAVF
jgi:hypothetical protein